MSYVADRAWSDSLLPAVCQIVGPRLLVPAPVERDMTEATDLIVLRARDMRIGVRLRRPGYQHYATQFTLRCDRASGAKTELAKILEGWGDWLFYGHADRRGRIASWLLVDLAVLRGFLWRWPDLLKHPDGLRCGRCWNDDGTAFVWFDFMFLNPCPVFDRGRA